MATNLVELIKSQFTPDVLQPLSAVVGESPTRTQEALTGAIPTLLAGLTNFASSGTGTTALANLLNQGDYGNLLTNLPSLLRDGTTTQTLQSSGRDLLSTLFGGRLSAVIDWLASACGIRIASASSLLSLVAPVVLGVLGKEQAAQGLNAAGLSHLLLSQKDTIARLAPTGLASVLGLSSLANLGAGLAGSATRVVSDRATRTAAGVVREGTSWWKWVLPALGLLFLGFLYSLWGSGPMVKSTLANITLPGGMTLSLPENSFNYNLARFLASATDTTVPRTFVFDRLNFDSGTTRLTAESLQTVNDLVVILKAYPTAAVQLAGHTDSTGEAEANKQLSLDRADAVKDVLVKGGIEASRLTTAGHGQEKPIASNATEEGKAKNRRLELVVASK
jgi:OmpA-OmpF porin, OOP family